MFYMKIYYSVNYICLTQLIFYTAEKKKKKKKKKKKLAKTFML